MGAQENVQIVRDAYAAFGRQDIPGLLALLADDVDWLMPGTGTPLAGKYRGRNEVANFFQKLDRDVEILSFEPREFVGAGDRVLVVGFERARVKATNRTIDVDWVMSFTVRNGKITAFQEYTDTQGIADAYGLRAQAAR